MTSTTVRTFGALAALALTLTLVVAGGTPASAAAEGSITGTVRHQVPGYTDGRVRFPTVDVYDADGAFVTSVEGTRDGRYTVSGLAPGSYEVVFWSLDGDDVVDFFPELYRGRVLYAPAGTPVTVPSGGTTRADGDLAPLFFDMFDTPFTAEIFFLRNFGTTKGCNPSAGNTLYCPDDTVTRGQMAAFLVRTLGLPPAPSAGFIDTRGTTFEDDIDRLAAAGITKGCNPKQGNTRFCPSDDVSREEMAAFLVRAFRLPTTTEDPGFTDVSGTFERDIARLAATDVTRGCNPKQGNTRFCPDAAVTRGQMAAFLQRSIDYVLRSTPTTSAFSPDGAATPAPPRRDRGERVVSTITR